MCKTVPYIQGVSVAASGKSLNEFLALKSTNNIIYHYSLQSDSRLFGPVSQCLPQLFPKKTMTLIV